MGKLVWLPEAKQDIARLFRFLRKKSPKAAKNAIKAIRLGAKQLSDFPNVGRPMEDDTGRRELVLAFGTGAYVIRYMLDDTTVVVIRVWHGREKR